MPYTFLSAAFAASTSFMVSLAFSLFFSVAWAQGLPPDDGGFEIETETQQDSGFDWNQYIGGSVGVVTADGDAISRQLAAMRLDINLPATDRVKTVLSIDAVDFENTYAQELRDHWRDTRLECIEDFPNRAAIDAVDAVADPMIDFSEPVTEEQSQLHDSYTRYQERLICEPMLNDSGEGYILPKQEIEASDSFADFREAYVQWEPTDYATVAVGRQNLVWGQFDFLSPVGFLLPFRTTNTSTRPSRADFAFAQDAAALSLFPTGNSELKLIHVPQMRVDPSVEENFKSYARNNYCRRDTQGDFTANCPVDDDNNFFPDAADYEMSALRFTHYGERLTFAVTALDGTQTSFEPYRDAKLVASGDGFAFADATDKGLAYGELETLALEFSYILNPRVTIKGEFVTYESFKGIEFGDETDLSSREQNLAHAVVSRKNGDPYITTDEVFLALGFDYEGDNWFGNVQLVALDSQPTDNIDEVLECIEDGGTYARGDISCRDAQFDDDDSDIFPVFFIGRRLGIDDEGFVGGGATAFFNAYGTGIFGGWRFNENIELGGFFGFVVDVTDSGPQSTTYYDSVDDGDSMAQIGITYLF